MSCFGGLNERWAATLFWLSLNGHWIIWSLQTTSGYQVSVSRAILYSGRQLTDKRNHCSNNHKQKTYTWHTKLITITILTRLLSELKTIQLNSKWTAEWATGIGSLEELLFVFIVLSSAIPITCYHHQSSCCDFKPDLEKRKTEPSLKKLCWFSGSCELHIKWLQLVSGSTEHRAVWVEESGTFIEKALPVPPVQVVFRLQGSSSLKYESFMKAFWCDFETYPCWTELYMSRKLHESHVCQVF